MRSCSTTAWTNLTASPLTMNRQILARVVCPLKFCNQSSSWVSGPEFLRNKKFPLGPKTYEVDNIMLGIVTKEQDDDSTSNLAAFATKAAKEPSIHLISFDKFSSYQKLLCVTAYMLSLLSVHESYRTVYGSITDPVELDEAEQHLQYFDQGVL